MSDAGQLSDWRLACPACRSDEFETVVDSRICRNCGNRYTQNGGVWDFLPPERATAFEDFLDSYTRIRHAEGRGGYDAGFFKALPDCPVDHPVAWQWAIRRRSYESLMGKLKSMLIGGQRIIDVGAGVGWLSNRLAQAGFRPCAIDISIDDQDGLGASRHYDGDWPLLRAEFDRLPLADNQADVLIFNASLHYSTDIVDTLKEACRVVVAGGSVIVLDTPVYKDEESGRKMLEEQKSDFERRFGDRSDALPHEGYLTWGAVERHGADLGLRWSVTRPWYGTKWAIRPLLARLRGGREPATFAILAATNPGTDAGASDAR